VLGTPGVASRCFGGLERPRIGISTRHQAATPFGPAMFWFYRIPGPFFYIMIMPGMGCESELDGHMLLAKKSGATASSAGSSIGIAIIGFLVGASHVSTACRCTPAL